MPTNKVIPTTVYFNTLEEKKAALQIARQEDKSLSQLVRDLLRKYISRKTP